MMGKMSERAVLYDVGDDWTAFHQNETLRRRAIAEDEHLTRQANAVVVVSEKLLQMKRTLRDKVHLVPNGADIEHYAPVAAHSLTPHPVTDKWKHPVLGHTGTLHPDRTDVELILSLARQFRFGTIALVGPLCVGSFFEEKFAGEPNIVMTGPMPYQELPRIMSVFDLCFVPQKVNDFTESQNPLKLFEYLASGLPIVSTPISGFRDYSELVHLAQTPQEFVAAAEAALNEDRNLAEKRRAAVTDHSWDARVDAIFEVFKGITAHKKN
jgi:glycosyltransferase involved in cell wall biosynthesis